MLDMAEISSYGHLPQHLHGDARPYTVPEGTLIVDCLIMLTHNHETEDGSHFVFLTSSSFVFADPTVGKAPPFKLALHYFSMPLMFTEDQGFQRPHPRLWPIPASFFPIELTYGPNLSCQISMSPRPSSDPTWDRLMA